MKGTTVQRWGGGAAVLGGLVWVAAGLLTSVGNAAASAWKVAPLLMIVALSLLLPGIVALYERWRVGREPLSTIGAIAAAGGLVVTVVDLSIGLLEPNAIRAALVSSLGALGILAICGGLLLLASLAMIDINVRGWQGMVLLVGLVGLFLPLGAGIADDVGTVVWIIWGLGWTWLGAILVVEGRRAALVPAREF